MAQGLPCLSAFAAEHSNAYLYVCCLWPLLRHGGGSIEQLQ